jgi:Fe2+ or Zn2+ uptake regulation protein
MKDLNLILGSLKTKGYKLTPVRKLIIEILINATSPLSISDLALKLRSKDLSPNKTTFYREVAFLKDLQILQEIDFGDGMKRYEISKEHHHHIVCIKCNIVKDVPMEKDLNSKEQKILKDLGFKPIGHSLEFFGLCSNCQ